MASIPSSHLTGTAARGRASTAAPSDHDTLIDMKEVQRRTGLAQTTIGKLIRAGTFPPRVKVTAHSTRFSAKAVDAWIQERIAPPRDRDDRGWRPWSSPAPV